MISLPNKPITSVYFRGNHLSASLKLFFVGALCALSALLFPSLPALAATISEIFLILPPEHVRNLSSVDRRAMLDSHAQGSGGYTPPNDAGYWVELHGEHSITLFNLRDAPIVYKVFNTTKGWQLLAICRSRQTYGPANANELPHETYLDMILYSVSVSNDLLIVDLADYLPEIGVWDFVTRETVTDREALRDLEAINQIFPDCLTCHASVQDSTTIDILTVTSINAHSCASLLPQFKLLPLKWEGYRFSKPYNRAALPENDKRPTDPRHGVYYHEPGK
jgi:hypothetical protein